jgi:hypothetical protein
MTYSSSEKPEWKCGAAPSRPVRSSTWIMRAFEVNRDVVTA